MIVAVVIFVVLIPAICSACFHYYYYKHGFDNDEEENHEEDFCESDEDDDDDEDDDESVDDDADGISDKSVDVPAMSKDEVYSIHVDHQTETGSNHHQGSVSGRSSFSVCPCFMMSTKSNSDNKKRRKEKLSGMKLFPI